MLGIPQASVSDPKQSLLTAGFLLVLALHQPVRAEMLSQSEAGSPVSAPLVNTTCPVMADMEVDPNISVEHEGKRVYLCCPNCRRTFLADPEPFLANLPQLAPGGAVETHGQEMEEAHAAHSHDDSAGIESEQGDHHEHAESGGAGVARVAPHDQAADHGQPVGIGRLIGFVGKFHPVVIHFPIALIMVTALADVLLLVTKSEYFRSAVRFLLPLVALSAVVSVPLGWAAAAHTRFPGEMVRVLWLHRWLGTGTGLLALLAFAFSEMARRRLVAWAPAGLRVSLYASAGLVGLTGHLGATLIYGPGHFAF